MKKITNTQIVIASLIFLAPSVAILMHSLFIAKGNFAYTLDDPYIHLVLAKNIWAGQYGINMIEASAPSSSIVWPFLLAPLSILTPQFVYVPLVINCLCVVLSGFIFLQLFSRLSFALGIGCALSLMVCLNVYGLVMTGMEHSLQVLLVLIIVSAFIHSETHSPNEESNTNKTLFYTSLFLLPLVRYEGLAISVPVLIYCFIKGDKKLAVFSFAALISTLAAFSLFLYSKGLGFLPSSVLAKTSHTSSSATIENFLLNIRTYGFLLVPVVLICINEFRRKPAYCLVLIAVTGLHFLFGKYGWYGRYEVYYLTFILVISLKYLLDNDAKKWPIVFILPFVFNSLVVPSFTSARASSNVHHQQGQMAKITKLLDDNVAVNDLGLVAYNSRHYVLDLWGLGSVEALTQRKSNTGNAYWIHDLMVKKQVPYAIIYDTWFPLKPDNWIKVAELVLLEKRITPASDIVSFYATSVQSAEKMKAVLHEFSRTHTSDRFSVNISDR
jgi:hypothetical protein